MKRNRRNFYWFVIAIVIISFIPLIYICKYNCPSADDYSYAITTFKVWNETHSIVEVLKEAVNTSVRFWNTWQGLYVSAFLLALQPAIFGVEWYAVTGIIMLLLIVGSTLIFSNYFICRLFKRSCLEGIAVGSVLSFLTIHFMPSCVEGIYWFNGAVNYGFFFAVLLVYICMLIELQMNNSKMKELLLLLGGVISAFFLEGGNHVTALMGIVATTIIFVVTIKHNKKKTIQNFVLLCMTLLFLFVNLKSPGTAIRYGAINSEIERYGVFKTIFHATFEGIESIRKWMGLKEIVMAIVLLPILAGVTTYVRENTKFKFRYPLLFLIASVAWICIMYCPPYMGMRSAGQGRLMNLVYYSFVILFFANITYIMGWIQGMFKSEYIENMSNINNKYIITVIVLTIAILISDGRMSWGYYALEEVVNGEAQQYLQEFVAREEIIKNSNEKKLVVPSLTVYPEVIYFDDITSDLMDWKNIAVSDYYGLESIIIE